MISSTLFRSIILNIGYFRLDSNPPSPEPSVPRKRIQIESDSDDDFKESPKKADKVIENESKKVVAGRKRVAKLISKTYVDKDGFLGKLFYKHEFN